MSTKWIVSSLLLVVLGFVVAHRDELPVFRCGNAQCDWQTKLWEAEWNAQQEMIDSFRSCGGIYVQKEDESLGSFFNRLEASPTGQTCLILRRSEQTASATKVTLEKNVSIYGGTFKVIDVKEK